MWGVSVTLTKANNCISRKASSDCEDIKIGIACIGPLIYLPSIRGFQLHDYTTRVSRLIYKNITCRVNRTSLNTLPYVGNWTVGFAGQGVHWWHCAFWCVVATLLTRCQMIEAVFHRSGAKIIFWRESVICMECARVIFEPVIHKGEDQYWLTQP